MKKILWKGYGGDYECGIAVTMNPESTGIHVFKCGETQKKEITLSMEYVVSRGDYGNYIDIYTDEKVAALLLSNNMGYFLPNANIEVDGRQYPYFVFNRQRLYELDPVGTKLYDNMRNRKLASKKVKAYKSKNSFDVIEIWGQNALMTCDSRYELSIPNNLFTYDVGFLGADVNNSMYLQEIIKENRYATIITAKEISIPEAGHILLKSEDIRFKEAESIHTFEEFERKFSKMDVNDTDITRFRRKIR